MIFWYTPASTLTPDTNEEHIILRPVVPLLVHGENFSGLFGGLVDTGADNTIFPKTIADELEIPLTPCLGPSPVAFGGERLQAFVGDVKLHLSDGKESCLWQCHVLFHEFPSLEDEAIVLGMDGFLNFFTAVFDGERGRLELSRNSTMPTV